MANLNVNNYDNIRLRVNKDEYWDFFVNKDKHMCSNYGNGNLYDKCLISYIDLSDSECSDGERWLYSKYQYSWDKAVSSAYTLNNISYTGIDNGLFTYRKDRISNKDFVELFKENKYDIEGNDNRLKLHAVSGNTLVYDYPMTFEDGYVKLNGGFFQGFFETECDKYQVLPSSFTDGDVLNMEFTLKKCDLEKESDKTLNDKYPENKGIFFFIGTRAENKWIYLYDKDEGECFELDISNFVEGAEIDPKSYIIGNFVDVRFEEETLDLDDYTDFNYYDESKSHDVCDWNDMYDYLDVDVKPKTYDESMPHETLDTWCCNDDNYTTAVRPFFRGCGCPVSYKRVRTSGKNAEVDWNDPFGDDYISDFDGVSDGVDCQEYMEGDLDISDFEYETDNGFNLSEANQYYFYTDNKFLFFNRTSTGKTVSDWIDGTKFMYYGRKNNFKGNLFILMNRTKTGYTVNNIDELRDKDINNYNVYEDLYNNALAFRVTDEGEIGYRFLTVDCEKEGDDKTDVIEGYSNKGVIPNCEWFTADVRVSFVGGNKMKLMFYVNGKLVYITREIPRLSLKALNDLYEKQEGVPYNLSLGGGTQGLCDTVQYNYMLEPSRVFPLERHFGGTFIGYLKSFKIYDCMLGKDMVENNYKYERKLWENLEENEG